MTATKKDLRSAIRPMRTKSTELAIAIFALDATLYACTMFLVLTARSIPGAFGFGTLEGVAIAMLFVVGHDACHGSFTSSHRLNRWIGRIAFLPSLTPFRAWEIGHNQTHHVYTNLKGADYVWAPFSKREFEALPRWRQTLERCYRTPLGLGVYYGVEIWWKRLFFVRTDIRGVLWCSGYGIALAAAAWPLGWTGFAAGVVWPFVVWNWLMGWAIFEHHTHPLVPWFDNEREWRAARAQSRCTVHVELPGFFDRVLHHIMQHTAHHLDVTVPLYRLKAAQRELEQEAAGDIILYRWTPMTFMRHLRLCKLYDFERHTWVGFDGLPVSAPGSAATPSRRA